MQKREEILSEMIKSLLFQAVVLVGVVFLLGALKSAKAAEPTVSAKDLPAIQFNTRTAAVAVARTSGAAVSPAVHATSGHARDSVVCAGHEDQPRHYDAGTWPHASNARSLPERDERAQ